MKFILEIDGDEARLAFSEHKWEVAHIAARLSRAAHHLMVNGISGGRSCSAWPEKSTVDYTFSVKWPKDN